MARHLPHDWYPEPLPPNVTIGERSWIYSSFAFSHFRSKIDPAVQIRAEGELARIRQSRASRNGGGNDRVEDHRAAVSGQLDDVFAGVRVRSREASDDEAIDRGAVGREDRRQGGVPRCEGGAPAQSGCDPLRIRPADSHHANPAAPGRGCDRHDRVVGGEHGGLRVDPNQPPG